MDDAVKHLIRVIEANGYEVQRSAWFGHTVMAFSPEGGLVALGHDDQLEVAAMQLAQGLGLAEFSFE